MTTKMMMTKTRKKKWRIGSSASLSVLPTWTSERVPALMLLRAFVLGLAMCLVAAGQQTDQTPPTIPAPGQEHVPPNTRVIQGTVRDKSGAPVAGAVVLLRDNKTLQIRSYLTQSDGTYHFFGLSTDVGYQLRAEHADMTSSSKLVSVFDSKKFIKVDLKLKKQKKPYPG